MKVGCDIDGVIADTGSLIVKALNDRGFEPDYTFYKPVIKDVENVEALIDEIVTDILSNRTHEIKPYEDSLRELHNIDKFVGPITFITARREEFNNNTIKWLNTHFPGISYGLVNKRSAEKPQFLLDEGFDFFIEDRLKTANKAAEIGIRTFLINRKWNMGRETHKDVQRISLFGTFFSLAVSKYM
jgi:uncharacterized HAD superfamily protein